MAAKAKGRFIDPMLLLRTDSLPNDGDRWDANWDPVWHGATGVDEWAVATMSFPGGDALTLTLNVQSTGQAHATVFGRVLPALGIALPTNAAIPAVDEDLYLDLPNASDDLYNRFLVAKRRSLTAQSFEEAKSAAKALSAASMISGRVA